MVSDEIRQLLRVDNDVEAELICELLRAAGIKCNHEVVPPEAWLDVFTHSPDGVAVYVRDSDLEQARTVLAEDEAGSPPAADLG